jgi:hypothetical protein
VINERAALSPGHRLYRYFPPITAGVISAYPREGIRAGTGAPKSMLAIKYIVVIEKGFDDTCELARIFGQNVI